MKGGRVNKVYGGSASQLKAQKMMSPPEVRLCSFRQWFKAVMLLPFLDASAEEAFSIPSKPETLEIYMIRTLEVKASRGFAAGTAELSISLSNRKSFLGNKWTQTQLEQGQGISTAHVAQARLS